MEWSPSGIRYEADQRHAEIIIKHLGLSADSKAVTTPGAKDPKGEEDGEDEELEDKRQDDVQGPGGPERIT